MNKEVLHKIEALIEEAVTSRDILGVIPGTNQNKRNIVSQKAKQLRRYRASSNKKIK